MTVAKNTLNVNDCTDRNKLRCDDERTDVFENLSLGVFPRLRNQRRRRRLRLVGEVAESHCEHDVFIRRLRDVTHQLFTDRLNGQLQRFLEERPGRLLQDACG